jgi:hypothetical protein
MSCACGLPVIQALHNMHEWLSGGVSPCQGEGRGFESRLVLTKSLDFQGIFCCADMCTICALLFLVLFIALIHSFIHYI